ncbi:MAG TPA: AMP-binding protein, partial [Terriglobia bacterium]|nr:AMP-binding protein [Terriglobia bacterium]
MTVQTINEVFYRVVERQSDRVMLYKRKKRWTAVTSQELYRNVVGVARTLTQWGFGKGDRVAILSENRPEWATSEFAILALGGVVIPIYPTLTAEQSAYMLRDSGARAIFVSSADQFKKVMSVRGETALEKIVVMDPIADADATSMAKLMQGGPSAREPEFDARALAVGPGELATIIYTSGTTGTPKGA